MTKRRNPERCGAKTRGERAGRTCRSFPVRGRTRCRMHGGAGSGRPPTHGRKTSRAVSERRLIRELLSSSLRTLALANEETDAAHRDACGPVDTVLGGVRDED